jgi:hypothetical protein
MTKHRGSRRHRSRSRSYKGGSYSSASTYGSYVNGSGDSQFNRVFDQGGAEAGRQSNVIIGAQGQWGQSPHLPNAQNLALVQSAGKRRNKRGGLWGEVINQAVVPLSLLGMQQTYGRKRSGGRTCKKRGGFIGEAINQAVVPLALLGMQQSYGRKRRGGKTRKHR